MIYFNLFPRTGSSFMATLCKHVLDSEITVIREPEKYKDNINQVVIFRNPYNTISSLIDRSRYHSFLKDENTSWTAGIDEEIKSRNHEYIKFIDLAIENFSNLQTGIFEDVIANPIDFLKKTGKRFDLNIIERPNPIETALEELKNMHSQGEDINYGHYVREKDKNRLQVEEAVRSSEFLKKSFEKYQIFAEMVKTSN